MTIERKPVRYAHSSGHTDVCYSENGEKLITCGTDGDIRIWSGFEDYDPVQTCVGEWSLCVRQKGNRIQIGTDNNNVQLLTYPNGERDGILTRFTAHVNHMAVGKNHNFIALAAEDMEVKIMDLSESKENTSPLIFPGLVGPPLSVALCPKADLICVASGDGYLRIWNVKTQTLLKDLNCVPKINSFMNAKLLCRMDFDPIFGKHLAYPDENVVHILSVDGWATHKKLVADSIAASFSIVQYSPCGNFLAAASEHGDVVIWDIPSQAVINCSQNQTSTAICAMVWNPLGNGEIAYCDIQGQLGIITNCISTLQISSAINETTDENAEVDFGDIQFEDDDDDDGENVVSLEKLKSSVMGIEPELQFDKESSASSSRPRTPEIPMQSPFMPSSTPVHLSPRYLCWNDVGIVKAYGTSDDESKSIEVEFHDATFHNSMMMQNFQNYTMGSLSSGALTVASSDQITVIPLTSSIKEWSLNVEEGKEITCIAASSKLICFSTSNYLVHICTVYGTQKAVISIPGPIISMAAYEDVLLLAYHGSSPRKDDQCINMMLVRFEGMSVVNKNLPCPLQPESNLFWLGFSDVGTPASLDSNGMLYLFPLTCNVWLPFCDTIKQRKGVSDGFFVTAIFETYQNMRGIRCKGSSYPGFVPRPTLSEIPLEPPFMEMSTEKSLMEANLFTWRILQVEDVDKKFVETGLKTFVLACKNNLDLRALELIELLENQQILSLALKYATKLDKRRLAEKLIELMSKSEFHSENSNRRVGSTNSYVTPKNIRLNRKLVLNSNSKSASSRKSLSEQPRESQNSAIGSEEGISTPSFTNDSDPDVTQDERQKHPFLKRSQQAPSTASFLSNSETDTIVDSQESLFTEEEPKNPFLKCLKQSKPTAQNPLSLIDKYAGFNVEKKENKPTNEIVEKRKQPDTINDTDKQKEKQRKLDRFMFSKQK
ncbi:hypothetical protein Trydic_g11333 [Trypoxylus dichotomus]